MSESTTQSKNGLNQGQCCPCLNFQALLSTISAKILLICLVELFMIQMFKYLYELDVKVGRKGTLAVCSAISAILSYKEPSLMTSLAHFLAIFDLPTYLVLLYNVPFLGLSWTPLPTLIWDIINERSLSKVIKICT